MPLSTGKPVLKKKLEKGFTDAFKESNKVSNYDEGMTAEEIMDKQAEKFGKAAAKFMVEALEEFVKSGVLDTKALVAATYPVTGVGKLI